MNRLLTALAVFAVSTSIYGATPSVFDGPRFVVPPAGDINDIRVADFDNDGKRDFAVASGASISVYRGKGDGTFALPVTSSSAGYNRFDVALLDGDAFPDLVTRASDGVRFHRGNGDGTFTPGSQIVNPSVWCDGSVTLVELSSDARADVVVCGSLFLNLGNGNFSGAQSGQLEDVYFADANGDGKQDAFTSRSGTVRLGNGDGTFQPAVWMDDGGPSAAGDFNADGRADYAWIDSSRYDLAVRLRNADGSYGPRLSAGFVTEKREVTIRTADLNGDGRADILVAAADHVLVSLSGPDGSPGTLKTYAVPPGVSEFATADFNGDALPDMLVGGGGDFWSETGTVTYLRGLAGGTFAAPRGALLSFATTWASYGAGPMEVAVGDVTGDARPDVVVVTSRGIDVLPGTGGVDFAEPLRTAISGLERGYGGNTVAFGDYTGDGVLDVIVAVSGQFACYVANGDGTFRHSVDLALNHYGSLPRLTGGDFDGDGNRDVVIDVAGLTLFRGRGNGTFDAPLATGFSIPYTQPLLAGDVNEDGADDLVLSETILLGSPSAAFSELDYDGYYIPVSAVVDLNDDGHLDLVRYDDSFSQRATVVVMLGDGGGSFGPRRLLEVDQRGGARPLILGVPGDFNADGNVDLLFGTTVLLGDGAGSFDGYTRYRYTYMLASAAAGDFDGNGTPDLVLVATENHSVDLVPTLTTESADVPLSLSITTSPATFMAGDRFFVKVAGEGTDAFSTSGGVTIAIGGTVAVLAELVDGSAEAYPTSYLPGTHSLTAVFDGDPVYAPAVAAPRSIEITRSATWSYPQTSPQNPTTFTPISLSGELYTMMLVDPTGDVVVTVDGVERGRVPAPSFDIALGLLTAGYHTIGVAYSGDSLHLPNTWSWQINVVKPTTPVVASVSPASTAPFGTSVTITATLPNEPALSSGTIRFSWLGKLLATVPVVNGSASLTTSGLEVGSSYILVSYSGNDTYRSSGGFVSYTVSDVPLASAPRSFYLIAPCRILDTRGPVAPSGGPLVGAAETRAIPMAGLCGIPNGAAALALNITVISPANTGFLTAFGGASPRPGTSTLNYRTGKTRANSAIMPLSASGRLNLFNGGPGDAHVAIDVTGYFQ